MMLNRACSLFQKSGFKTPRLAQVSTSQTHSPVSSTFAQYQARAFASQRDRNHSGLRPKQFDFDFESRFESGRFPH